MTTQKTISPIDGSLYVERRHATRADIDPALTAARKAFESWRRVPVEERGRLLTKAVDHFVARGDAIAAEITHQMGRPIGQSPGEVRGFAERARHMIAIAP